MYYRGASTPSIKGSEVIRKGGLYKFIVRRRKIRHLLSTSNTLILSSFPTFYTREFKKVSKTVRFPRDSSFSTLPTLARLRERTEETLTIDNLPKFTKMQVGEAQYEEVTDVSTAQAVLVYHVSINGVDGDDFNFVIVDEAHHLRNSSSSYHTMISMLDKQHTI